MRKMNQITAVDTNGHGFVLTNIGLTSFGEMRVSLEFTLSWAKGAFEFITSEYRIHEFVRAIVEMNGGESGSFSYINDEGNIEITVMPTGRGDATIDLVGIPNMAKDERLEFEVEGAISCSQ